MHELIRCRCTDTPHLSARASSEHSGSGASPCACRSLDTARVRASTRACGEKAGVRLSACGRKHKLLWNIELTRISDNMP